MVVTRKNISNNGYLEATILVNPKRKIHQRPILTFRGLPIEKTEEFMYGLEEKIEDVAKTFSLNNKKHAEAGTMELVENIIQIPASNYFDQSRWEKEVDLIFKRLPLVLGVSKEIPNPGDYKAIEALGIPVLIIRNSKNEVKAFLNACVHRGAALVKDGIGNKKRFSCPYHGWTYNCLLYTSPSPRDRTRSRMPSSA